MEFSRINSYFGMFQTLDTLPGVRRENFGIIVAGIARGCFSCLGADFDSTSTYKNFSDLPDSYEVTLVKAPIEKVPQIVRCSLEITKYRENRGTFYSRSVEVLTDNSENGGHLYLYGGSDMSEMPVGYLGLYDPGKRHTYIERKDHRDMLVNAFDLHGISTVLDTTLEYWGNCCFNRWASMMIEAVSCEPFSEYYYLSDTSS